MSKYNHISELEKIIYKYLSSILLGLTMKWSYEKQKIVESGSNEAAKEIFNSIHLCSCVDGLILTNEQAEDGKFKTKQCPICLGKGWFVKG